MSSKLFCVSITTSDGTEAILTLVPVYRQYEYEQCGLWIQYEQTCVHYKVSADIKAKYIKYSGHLHRVTLQTIKTEYPKIIFKRNYQELYSLT